VERSQRKAQIYAVAARLFSQQGYHATTIRQVARELDLQGGSLYAHIDAKEDVLWGIVSQAAEEFLTALRPIAHSHLPPDEKLRAALRAHVGVVAENINAATVYFQDWKYLSAPRRETLLAQRDEYEGMFRAIVAKGVEAGVFRSDIDVKAVARLALSAGNWLYQWYRPDGPLSPNQVADQFADIFLPGMIPHLTAETAEAAETRIGLSWPSASSVSSAVNFGVGRR
jgi:TetR/AcrR family transcriptional regulator, cholesterol catabolism regulator